jgi:hypothetical protein
MDLIESLFKRRPTKTKEGLPLVTEETRLAFIESLQVESEIRENSGSILREWAERVREENPEFGKYVIQLISEYAPEERGSVLASVVSGYELLRTQALNDKIKEKFGIKD